MTSGPETSDPAFAHCESLVREHDKDRFLASLFAPAERRRFLFALYAFDLEIARVKYLVHEPMAGTIRLQWWYEAFAGLRESEAAAHPVVVALRETTAAAGLDTVLLLKAVEARQDELQGESPVGAVSAIIVAAAQVLGASKRVIAITAESAARALVFSSEPADLKGARSAYKGFRAQADVLPAAALPAFLPVALVPLRLARGNAAQWRRQIVLARAAWFGFPKV
jgi:phytoene synthase